jgi:hypothetical protein
VTAVVERGAYLREANEVVRRAAQVLEDWSAPDEARWARRAAVVLRTVKTAGRHPARVERAGLLLVEAAEGGEFHLDGYLGQLGWLLFGIGEAIKSGYPINPADDRPQAVAELLAEMSGRAA